MAQEMKSNLQPDINDTLMHYLETSTVWLYRYIASKTNQIAVLLISA